MRIVREVVDARDAAWQETWSEMIRERDAEWVEVCLEAVSQASALVAADAVDGALAVYGPIYAQAPSDPTETNIAERLNFARAVQKQQNRKWIDAMAAGYRQAGHTVDVV